MASERIQIVGIEINEGISKKTGKPYAMGSLHTMTRLAPPMGGGDNVAKGFMGDKFECDPNILRRITHLPFPLAAEVDIESQMRFGDRVQIVTDVRPTEVVKKAA